MEGEDDGSAPDAVRRLCCSLQVGMWGVGFSGLEFGEGAWCENDNRGWCSTRCGMAVEMVRSRLGWVRCLGRVWRRDPALNVWLGVRWPLADCAHCAPAVAWPVKYSGRSARGLGSPGKRSFRSSSQHVLPSGPARGGLRRVSVCRERVPAGVLQGLEHCVDGAEGKGRGFVPARMVRVRDRL